MSQNASSRVRFSMPIALAIATAIGLLSALLGDGIWDGLSWLLLVCPLLGVVYCFKAARAARRLPRQSHRRPRS